jgi:hypothetical protein
MIILLNPAQVAPLLYELCVKLGFCLPSADQRRLERDPPTDIDSFTDAVFVAEGMDPKAHRHLRHQVRARVATHFAKAAEAAG